MCIQPLGGYLGQLVLVEGFPRTRGDLQAERALKGT